MFTAEIQSKSALTLCAAGLPNRLAPAPVGAEPAAMPAEPAAMPAEPAATPAERTERRPVPRGGGAFRGDGPTGHRPGRAEGRTGPDTAPPRRAGWLPGRRR
ncbi:hypothetical protein [Streptomyces sp. Ag109_O5-10]|uniref:hypothetical protein n=1 Tax=Streptomyces sp. Ag109_O5-10 TaxID=1855349 RepID=UPI00115FCF25|nr:hypothetical protein [Streptomyces sp. Ag109_O5-10]